MKNVRNVGGKKKGGGYDGGASPESSVLHLARSMSLLMLPSEESSSQSSCSLRTPSMALGFKANDPLGTNVAMSMIPEQMLN